MPEAGSRLPEWLNHFIRYLEKPRRLVLGLHSGTSTDGPTAALAFIAGNGASARLELVAYKTYDYAPSLRAGLLAVMERTESTVDRVCQLDIAVGEFFSQAATDLAMQAGVSMNDVDLIASSGQVAYQVIAGQRGDHDLPDGSQYTAMLDLGEGAVIASRCGVPTISSLRRKDNALGGFGAPLVPMGDWILFRSEGRPRVVWNIGGICNATVLPGGCSYEAVWAFDAGPGNMVIDRLVDDFTAGERTYDAGGALAREGKVSRDLLEHSMKNSFIQQPPPKAAARQIFGLDFVNEFRAYGAQLGLNMCDLLATATALTAETVAYAQNALIDPVAAGAELIFTGGGVRNDYLMQLIRERLPSSSLLDAELFGVPIECREVFSMMLIANETVHGSPGNCPAATGAKLPAALGHIDLPK